MWVLFSYQFFFFFVHWNFQISEVAKSSVYSDNKNIIISKDFWFMENIYKQFIVGVQVHAYMDNDKYRFYSTLKTEILN